MVKILKNDLVIVLLKWNYELSLFKGIKNTFSWIEEQINNKF